MPTHSRLFFILAVGIGLAAVLVVSWQWVETSVAQEQAVLVLDSSAFHSPITKEKPKAQIVKGLYLTAYSAGNPKKIEEIVNLIDKTELNAVVIDIKDYSGKILYNSNLIWVNKFKTKENRLGNVKALIKKLHDNSIYIIARQTVFQDPLLAKEKPEWAIKAKSGGLWHDNKGLTWVDPTRPEVWNYNVAIAKEVIKLGFDEINFDYVRFPSDGNMSQVIYTNGQEEKYEIMRKFYSFLRRELDKEPTWISFDMFGYVMERTDDLRIGQRLVDAVDYADYISPMMYPSHYSKNSLGYVNPAEIPGLIIENGMRKGLPTFKDKHAKVRPWLQAFDLGAMYSDGPKIREQIDAVEKYENAGWLLWNAANRYSANGLKEK